MSKISGQLLISEQFQDICDISGISGQLGAPLLFQDILGLTKVNSVELLKLEFKGPIMFLLSNEECQSTNG